MSKRKIDKEEGGNIAQHSTSGFCFSPSRKTICTSVHFKLASIQKDPYKITTLFSYYADTPSNYFSFFSFNVYRPRLQASGWHSLIAMGRATVDIIRERGPPRTRFSD